MNVPIYLDHNATTPLDSRVLERMMPWMTEGFWNASSSHAGGRLAAKAVEDARRQVAALLGARASEIVITSGATEANNLALKGVLQLAGIQRNRLVTFATEHKAVLDTAEWLATTGTEVTVLPVNTDGTIDLCHLEEQLAPGNVGLVSVMAANNETGVLADLTAISDLAHHYGALVHTDATQRIGKLSFRVPEARVDLASMSAHKMYGPKGVGALFVSRRVELLPMMHGGGHERGMRSGTLNVPAIVGMGEAAAICMESVEVEADRQCALRTQLTKAITSRIPNAWETTATGNRLPNTANLRFEGADAEAVMANAPDVAISSGSACTSLVPTPSHVLMAMGFDPSAASECLRFSLGRTTTALEIDAAVTSIERSVRRVRELDGGTR